MVMEASPSPQSVGREFVRQYYTLLNKAPTHLHRFYNNYSSFVHGGLDAPNRETLPVVGQKQIHNRIQQLNFRDCHAKISQVDAQATLGNGVVVQVTGELSNGGAPMRRFTQTFVLAAQAPKQYYVHNDIFRYQDIVVSDEEGSLGARSEGSEDEGYLPPPHYPRRASPPPPPPLQLNGHPPAQSIPPNPAANVGPVPVAAPPVAPAAPPAAPVERSPEPEPAPSPPPPTPPPPQLQEMQPATPQPAAPPEPKTYANLVKSGAAPAPRADGAAPPREPPQEPRPPRRHPAAAVSSEPGPRRYSDAQQLFLGNVPPHAGEEQLRALFARFGPLADLRLHTKSGSHPNYGFVTFESASSAAACLAAAPLYFGADAVKLNVEEKKRRPAPRAPRAAPPPRPPRR